MRLLPLFWITFNVAILYQTDDHPDDPWVGPAQGIDSTISQKRSPFQTFHPGLSAFKAFNRYAQFKSFKTSEDQI
jgi:hypothetical protein